MGLEFNKIFGSLDNYGENLKIFEDSLKNNPDLVKDKEFLRFIDIFKSINSCSQSNHAQLENLQIKLVTIESRVGYSGQISKAKPGEEENYFDEELDSNFMQPIVRPLLGQAKTVADLANDYPEGTDINKGLKLIDELYTFRSIRGDGHCLFRSILTGLLAHLKAHPEAQENFLDRLEAYPDQQNCFRSALERLNHSKGLFANIAQAIYQRNPFASIKIDALDSQVEEILNDEAASDELVKALRAMAVAYEEAQLVTEPQGTLAFILNSSEDGNGNARDYLKKMKDMSGTKVGGEPELIALENILGIGINILDSESTGRELSRAHDPNQGIVITRANGTRPVEDGKIHILHRGYHYDFVMPKTK